MIRFIHSAYVHVCAIELCWPPRGYITRMQDKNAAHFIFRTIAQIFLSEKTATASQDNS